MELFRELDLSTSEKQLQELLTISKLEDICPTTVVFGANDSVAETGSNWGEFRIRRDEITGGVRFSMLNCPNALAWTITTGYPPSPEKVLIHATLNRTEKNPEFINELNEFLDDWSDGIRDYFNSILSDE